MYNEQLQYFISAAQCLNFSEVARRYYLTQPAISHHINDLEQYLGVRLFLRVGRQVLLTSEGELFLPEAIAILEKMQSAMIKVRRHSEGKAGTIAIGLVNTSYSIFAKCLAVFSRRYPDIQVDVFMTSGVDQAISIREEKYDFNFTIQAMISGDNRFDYTVSHHDQYCLALPREHPLTDRPLDFSELADEPFVIIRMADAPLLHSHIVEICNRRGYKPKIISHYNRAEAVLLSVAAGAGISILPREIIQVYCSDHVACIPIPGEDCLLSSVIVWKKNITNSPAVKFRGVVLELFPKNTVPAEAD